MYELGIRYILVKNGKACAKFHRLCKTSFLSVRKDPALYASRSLFQSKSLTANADSVNSQAPVAT